MKSLKPKIFLSSTFEDLKDYRQAAIDCLQKIKSDVKGMEFFGARNEKPLEVCLNEVEQSNIYIGILGMKYGSVDEETGKSFTHLEYKKATELELPRHIFLIDENNQPVLPKNTDIGELGILLREFKNDLKTNHTVEFFTTPDDLAKRIRRSLEMKFEDLDVQTVIVKSPLPNDFKTNKLDSFSIDRGEPKEKSLNIEINKNTSFYLRVSTQTARAEIVVYLKFRTDRDEEKWVGFGTVESIHNSIKSEHVFRIGYPSSTQVTIKEKLLDKIAESGLELAGIPTKLIMIRFRNDSDLDGSIDFEYGFDDE